MPARDLNKNQSTDAAAIEMPTDPYAPLHVVDEIALRDDVRAALPAGLPGDAVETILSCMSAAVLRPMLVRSKLCASDADDRTVVRTYFSGTVARQCTPNVLFDEPWYQRNYPEVEKAIASGAVSSGFVHFVIIGIKEGRWPNPVFKSMAIAAHDIAPPTDDIDEAAYLSATPYARAFLRCFPILSATTYYNTYGRVMGDRPVGSLRLRSFRDLLSEFDDEWYARTYMAHNRQEISRGVAFDHYLTTGLRQAHSPNDWFDESWYRAFYPDIRAAIASGIVACGFQHYLITGRAEERLPKFNLTQALEVRLPGVTAPTLLHRVPDLERRFITPVFRVVPGAPGRIWFVMPWINPDIAFGGHIAALELMNALHRQGYSVGIICTEDPRADKTYFLWRETRAELRQLITDIPVINMHHTPELLISKDDSFLAYSAWDLRLASILAAATERKRVMLMAQEYEPAFHANSSIRLLCERAYDIPHFPIINSRFLLKYLRAHRIGPFRDRGAQEGRDFSVFEHRVKMLPRQVATELAARPTRTLVAYARPEQHAERNLFEIMLIALRQACTEGVFGPEWRFVGVGALSSLPPIPLGGEHMLVMHQKMTEEEYHAHVRSVDIGVSLMYAPHPSVVPFELATAGAIVVTNTYENRSAGDLTKICANIVPAAPSVDGIVGAIRAAVARVEDFEARAANALVPAVTGWDQSFPLRFLREAFGEPHTETAVPVAEARPLTRAIKPKVAKPRTAQQKRLSPKVGPARRGTDARRLAP
jgi:hypothetical protein